MFTDVNTKVDFNEKINEYNSKNYVFRGQVKDYPFATSFERQTCIPSQKARWEYYCYNAFKMILPIEIYQTMNYDEMSTYIDSLLQHYGWRSMQLDITKNIDVAAFFACHIYIGKTIFQATEDYDENFVIEKISTAEYTDNLEDYGYIYIFDIEQIKRNKKLCFVDLTDGIINDNCRPVKQSGCVVSSFPRYIENEISPSVLEVIKVKSAVLLEYCSECKMSVDLLFPTADEDLIYQFLLSLPSKEFIDSENKKTGFYLKELDIPDYHFILRKIQSPAKAYYSTFWIYDNLQYFERGRTQIRSKNYTYYKCNSDDCFGYFSEKGNYLEMPCLISLVREKNDIILEFNNIFRYFASSITEYQKAVRFKLKDNLIEVREIVIDWAGKSPFGFGELMPRYYKIISDSEISPVRLNNDCPCNDDDRHLHGLLVGKYFTQLLSEGYFNITQEAERTYLVD